MPVPPPPQGTRRALLAAGAGASLGLLGGCASTRAAAPSLLQAPAAQLPGTHQQDLRDPASGRTWRVWAQRPAGPAPATGHPVLYVLDGNAAFDFLTPEHLALAPGLMIVGVGYDTDRQFARELRELFGLQLAEVGWDIHRVEQRRMRTVGHRAVIMVTAETVERKGA